MTPKEITLNIAVNLGRIARFTEMGNGKRADFFLKETKDYLDLLEHTRPQGKFKHTFDSFKETFTTWFNMETFSPEDVGEIYTWANILSHRAKLA